MASIEDYLRAVQFAQYLRYKSLLEGFAPSDLGVALHRFSVEGVEPRAHLPEGALRLVPGRERGVLGDARGADGQGGAVRAISNLRD